MNLPADFLQNIRNSFGAEGEQWLVDLPDLLEQAVSRWDLKIGAPMLLSYNYVTAAQRMDGTPVVLKLGVPNRELISELCALRYFDGDGCVRLLESDDEKSMFLLERLDPGEMLVNEQDDDIRTRIAAELMAQLRRPAPEGLPFIQLSDWFSGLTHLRTTFSGGTGPFPRGLFERVERLLPDLFAGSHPDALIHGDFHHFNILSSTRGWLAIDPKGVVGSPEYECGPLLTNPIPDFPYLANAARQTARRIAILSERLGYSRESIRDWGLCHAILSAWWDLKEDGTGTDYALACAEIISRAQI